MRTKQCIRCEEIEPEVEFGYHNSGGKQRKRTYCKSCEADISRKANLDKKAAKQRRGAASKNPPGWVTIEVPCHNHKEGCENSMDFSMPKEYSGGPHYWFCPKCKESGSPEERKPLTETGTTRIAPGTFGKSQLHGKVKTYRAGDKGFEERARQCTHIKKIEKVGERKNGYISDMRRWRRKDGPESNAPGLCFTRSL